MQKLHRLDMSQTYSSPPCASHLLKAIAGDAANDPEEGDNECSGHLEEDEPVTFSMFQEIVDKPPGLYLMLGYGNGFQLWNVSNPGNVHEVCSIRGNTQFGAVKFMHILTAPQNEDQFLNERPLLAIVENLPDTSVNSMKSHCSTKEPLATVLHIYSLRTHRVVKSFHQWAERGENINSVQSNGRFVALSCTRSATATTRENQGHGSALIRLLGSGNLVESCEQLSEDVFCQPGTSPVFAMGSRYLAYVSSAELPTKATEPFLAGIMNSDKDMMKEAAKDIASEVVNGVRYLSSYGYRSLSNYFSNEFAQAGGGVLLQSRTATAGSDDLGPGKHSTSLTAGMVMIRDLHIMTTPAAESGDCVDKTKTKKAPSAYAHFRAYKHPITKLIFNNAGTLLFSASNQGHVFHVYSLVESDGPLLIYKLTRGITDALVSDVQFSPDSLWCAVSTVKGTTHIFAINPYGGQPDASAHAQSRVTNLKHRHFQVGSKGPQTASLSPIARIRQRRPMPSMPEDGSMVVSERGVVPIFSSSSVANLTTLFLPATKEPSFVDPCLQSSAIAATKMHSTYTGSSLSFPWLGNHTNYRASDIPASVADQGENRPLGFEEEENTIGRAVASGHRDMYSFHPVGTLTLHRSWITQVLVDEHGEGRMEEHYKMDVEVSDVAEWQITRQRSWPEVKEPLDASDKHKKNIRWLAFAEIATYDQDYDRPIWQVSHITFHTFDESLSELEEHLRDGNIPSATQVLFKRELSEIHDRCIDDINKTSAVVHAEPHLRTAGDDALKDLEGNMISAMGTLFLPPSKKSYPSPSVASPAGNCHLPPVSAISFENMTMDDMSTISFDDAYHVQLGSEGWQHPRRSPILDDDMNQEEESGMGEFLFSPDGDNEIDSPYDSVIGNPEFCSVHY
ncbi:hypothetical protein BX666DRAFT_1945148 [Dichotomocladium elegans]|nr:hypothetical protein BX666DRAFT_1945148 [Dichotomocladium elegans]